MASPSNIIPSGAKKKIPPARIKTPRDAKGIDDLRLLEKTSTSVFQSRIPPKSGANARHCHALTASRDVKRIDRRPWEKRMGAMLRIVEQHRFERVNALHNALRRVNLLLADARQREGRLKRMTVELEQTSAYLQTLMDAMADILIATDLDGRITEVNRAAERLSGYPRERLIDHDLGGFFSDPGQVRDGLERVRDHLEISDFELTLMHADGTPAPVMLNARALRDETGAVNGVLINARDIRELKQAQEAREQYARELARANADLEEFASLASHELKEPLKKVITHAESLAHKYRDLFDGQAVQDLSFMVEQTLHMQSLIKHVLDYARVETGAAVQAPVSCDQVLDQAMVNLSGALEESPVRVQRDPLPTVMGDAGQLTRLFQNLVANALKYYDAATSDPWVRIRAQPVESADIPLPQGAPETGWLFSVEDNGIGIDPEFQNDIFKMFVRLHARDEYSGEGMGLAIAWRIVRRHNGVIWAVSEPGRGSTFYFTLPGADENGRDRSRGDRI